MRLNDSLCNRKPESDASAVGLARLPESLKQVSTVLGWNPRSGVGHLEDDLATVAPSAERDASACRRELDCVCEKIPEHLSHALAIGAHVERLVGVLDDQVDRFVDREMPNAVGGRREQIGRCDLRRLERKVTCFHSDDVEEIADESLHLPDGTTGGAEHFLTIGGRE